MVNKVYKFHYIYKTTNLLNNKYYIGMHSTDQLEDGYLGSGKILKASIKKYGKENFQFEIIEQLSDRKSLKEREREIVNEEEVNNKLCMNLQLGGGGGFSSEEHAYKFHAAGGKAVLKLKAARHNKRMKEDSDYRSKCVAKTLATKSTRTYIRKPYFHSKESIDKIRLSKQNNGLKETNSQYGTCWITNEVENKKIKKDVLETFLSQGWKLGRTYK